MVVGIHIPFFISPYLLNIYRIAVPIFLMISGYFLVGKDGTISERRISKILKKIFIITVTTNLIYYVFKAFVYGIYKWPVVETILVGSTLNGAMWYMNTYMQALIIIWVIVKLRKTQIFPWIAIFGLLLNLILGSYYWLIWDAKPILTLDADPNPYALNRNFLTIGLPCIIAGIWIRLKERPLVLKKLLTAGTILLIAVYAECEFIKYFSNSAEPAGDIIIFTLPLAIIIFLLGLNVPQEMRLISGLAYFGKNHSTNLFLFHVIVRAIILLIAIRIPFYLPDNKYWVLPTTIISMIAISEVIKWSKNMMFKSSHT